MKYLAWLVIFFATHAMADCTLQMAVDGGSVSAATFDYLERGQKQATDNKCSSILLLVNTPGGNLKTTRLIVENILNSELPYLCLIYPSGAHAGSAGAIIMQACHVSGAMESTNIGAATPVSGQGTEMSEDLRKKIINDTVSWVHGLTEKRKRNRKFGEELVTEAKSVSGREAVKLGGIDVVVKAKQEFLDFADGKVVDIANNQGTVTVGNLEYFDPDTRYRVLEFITDPQFAYFIFMGSLGLLYFEFTNPGTLIPGIVGSIGLLVSLVSFHKLEVSMAGLVLMLLGLGFMMAEPFVPSFGALAAGGIVSFIMGGLFLFDDNPFGYTLPFYDTILPVAVSVGLAMLILARILVRSQRKKKLCGEDQIIGKTAMVIKEHKLSRGKGKYKVLCEGAIWTAVCDSKIFSDEEVDVVGVDGLILHIAKKKDTE